MDIYQFNVLVAYVLDVTMMIADCTCDFYAGGVDYVRII